MKAEELSGPIVNHHVRCFEQAKHEITILTKHNVNVENLKFECICATLPTIEELNEALEV